MISPLPQGVINDSLADSFGEMDPWYWENHSQTLTLRGDVPHGSRAEKLDDTTTSGDLLSEEGAMGGGARSAEEDSLYSAASDLTQATTQAGTDLPSPL